MIKEFQGQYRFLSNFWTAKVILDGQTYPSVEHAYQAAKTISLGDREQFQYCDAGTAKRLGRRLKVRSDWEQVKLQIMEDLVRQKFSDNKLAHLLLCTGDEELQEGNYWNDRFWGISPAGSGQGLNHLGKILMKVRDEIRTNLDSTT